MRASSPIRANQSDWPPAEVHHPSSPRLRAASGERQIRAKRPFISGQSDNVVEPRKVGSREYGHYDHSICPTRSKGEKSRRVRSCPGENRAIRRGLVQHGVGFSGVSRTGRKRVLISDTSELVRSRPRINQRKLGGCSGPYKQRASKCCTGSNRKDRLIPLLWQHRRPLPASLPRLCDASDLPERMQAPTSSWSSRWRRVQGRPLAHRPARAVTPHAGWRVFLFITPFRFYTAGVGLEKVSPL